MNKQYDRKADDLGNIVAFEHINVTIPDQSLGILFYVTALGLTRDPYMTVGLENMWINIGQQQFHLPTRGVQNIPGHIGLVFPDLEPLKVRLESVRDRLASTKFEWSVNRAHIDVTCPWGNHFRCHKAAPEFGDMDLGLAYVDFRVSKGKAEGIAKFYKEVMQAPVSYRDGVARVSVGRHQRLVFTETSTRIPGYDGHHIAVYIANFSKPHAFLRRSGLITEESNAHQYRFQKIIHPRSGELLFQLEHEVRSLYHPMYGRNMVNRNPTQTQRNYVPGKDAYYPVGAVG